MGLDALSEVLENLTEEDIIFILTNTLGAHTYIQQNDYIIFPTVCHNINSEDAKMKLYYYTDRKLFHCYTECGETFNLYTLFKKYYSLRNIEYSFYKDILLKITSKEELQIVGENKYAYQPQRNRFKTRDKIVELAPYPNKLIDVFLKQYPVEWNYENISDKTMELFNIRFAPIENKIIIPHYDINNNLVGIRGRALNEEEIENYGKYAPVRIENKIYKHPLSLNLYGINLNKENIKTKKYVILFEAEKSVLLYEEYFGREQNVALAVCGSNFNKLQLNLLLKNFNLCEIVLAFDKEYVDYPSKKANEYFKRMEKLCKKYSNYCNFSFIYDTENLLKEKDAPIDKGKKTFENLLRSRVKIK